MTTSPDESKRIGRSDGLTGCNTSGKIRAARGQADLPRVAPSQLNNGPYEGERPELLTVEEVAERLRLSKTTVYRLIESRSLPFYRVGGVIRFEACAIRAFLAQHLVGPIIDKDEL